MSFFGLSFAIGGWALGIAGFLLTNEPEAAFNWAKLYYFFPILISASLVFFTRSFPDYSRVPQKVGLITLLGGVALVTPLILMPDFLITDLVHHDWGKEIVLDKVHYLLYSTYLILCFVSSLFHIYKKSKREEGLYVAQAELFFRGFIVAAFFGVLFNLAFPWVGNYRFIWVGPPFTAVLVVSVAYSIIKHRMFDVRLVVARSLGYLFSFLSVAIFFGVIAFSLLSVVFFKDTTIDFRQEIILTLLAVGIAFTYQPLKKFFDKYTNKVFYRDAYDPQELLDTLNRTLVTNIELNKLLTDASSVIGQNLKSEFCVFSLGETAYAGQRTIGDTDTQLSAGDVDKALSSISRIKHKVIVTDYLDNDMADLKRVLEKKYISILACLTPTTEYEVGGIGYLALGAKKSGNPYSMQDAKTLEIIANELAIAIQNALRFEEIEEFNVTLQGKVNDATRQLRHTNDKLKALDETKDEFISMASHQLRTPLTSVKGYVSMVLDGDAGKLSASQRKLLTQSFISSQRMVYLIADLLNISRLKTGKFVIEATPTNLADVVEGEVGQLIETAAGRNLTLVYEKPKDFPTLMLDETKIRQVMMNFIDNAIYYSRSGGHVEVKLSETPESVEFVVVDDGIGVPKSEQHNLFNKFYRAGNAKKARPDGTGLGLFMAKKVIIAQGGSIIFKSQEGKGSSFGFTFAKAKLKV